MNVDCGFFFRISFVEACLNGLLFRRKLLFLSEAEEERFFRVSLQGFKRINKCLLL